MFGNKKSFNEGMKSGIRLSEEIVKRDTRAINKLYEILKNITGDTRELKEVVEEVIKNQENFEIEKLFGIIKTLSPDDLEKEEKIILLQILVDISKKYGSNNNQKEFLKNLILYFEINYENLLKENLTETKIELYKIEEKRQNHNNQEFIDKKIKKIYVFPDELKRTKTLVLMDVEENKVSKIFYEIQKMAGFLEIMEVCKLSEFKKSINKTEKRYGQIVIVSTSSRINDIKNLSKIPIYLLSIENLKTSMTSVKRKDYLMGKILILEDLIKEYQNLISEREASVRLIKRNKRRKERELQKKKKLLEIKSKIERMRKQKK